MSIKKEKLGSRTFDVINYIICGFICIICLYPFLYMFFVSISDYEAVGMGQVRFLPVGFQLESYEFVFKHKTLLLAFWNSIKYTVTYVILYNLLNCMGGYVLSLKQFVIKKIVVVYLSIPMYVGGGLIATFLLIRSMGLYNTSWAFLLPAAVSSGVIFMYMTYIRSNVPDELRESVYIDGGSDITILFNIIFPLIKPILATYCLISAVSMWNEYFGPMLYLTDSSKVPISTILRDILVVKNLSVATINDSSVSFEGIAMGRRQYIKDGLDRSMNTAIVLVALIPILIIYPFIQRYYVKGMMTGAVKG